MIELTAIKFLLESNGDYIPHLSKHMFSGDMTRFMFESIQKYYSRSKSVPTLSELKISLYQKYDDGDSKKKVRRYLRTLTDGDISTEYSKDLITNLIQKSQVRNLINKYLPNLDSLDPLDMATMRQDFSKIVDQGSAKFDVLDFDSSERRNWDTEKVVPTFSTQLNEYLLGGLAPGELGLIQANPGIGKTLTSINMSFAGAISGHIVWFVTLDEMRKDIATRMDMKMQKYRGKRLWRNNIKLIDFSGGARLSDLEILINQEGTPGLIILDGTDDFIVDGNVDPRSKIGVIYGFIRRLSRRRDGAIPVWATTQSTAASEGKLRKGMFDVTENKIVKAGESSVVISINQTEEEADANMARLYISKIRRPCGPGKTIKLEYSREYQSLKDEDDQGEEIIEGLNKSKRR